MKFRIKRASDPWSPPPTPAYLEIETLEDLRKLSLDQGGEDLIIEWDFGGPTSDPTITIYDDYIE